jgi:hypothetical protein
VHNFPVVWEGSLCIYSIPKTWFLVVAIINNGKTLSAKFYDNDGAVKDQFTIIEV